MRHEDGIDPVDQLSALSTEVWCDALGEQTHRAGNVVMGNGGHGHAADQVGNAEKLTIALDLFNNLGRIADDKTVPGQSCVVVPGIAQQSPAPVTAIGLHQRRLSLLMGGVSLWGDVHYPH